VHATQLCVDRILEAHEPADPVHIMRLFGLSSMTAMNYVTSAVCTRQKAPTSGGRRREGRRSCPACAGAPSWLARCAGAVHLGFVEDDGDDGRAHRARGIHHT
jgi:hypothetical protein